MGSHQLFATHNRAGEILFELIAPFTYRATIVTYTDSRSIPADRDSLRIDWGDGVTEFVARTNGPDGDGNGVPDGEVLGNNIKKNIYIKTHQYAGALPYYIISMVDPNRNADICNITNSVQVPFYLEDTIFFQDPALIGFNTSPILLNPPVDFAVQGTPFLHNPNAYDPDGDSLVFSFTIPKATAVNNVPGYLFPDEVNPGPDNNFSIDISTGEVVWDSPQTPCGCEINFAILIREYRNGVHLSSIIRDMQVRVLCNQNQPPVIEEIRDTCVWANEFIQIPVVATDPDSGQTVTLSANGGPFELNNSPASFVQTPGNPANGTFSWQTICNHIRPQFYSVVFKAEDDFSPNGVDTFPLFDLQTWLIRVIPPPPDTLFAEAQGNQIVLNWTNPYTCSSFQNFRGFSVWRRVGSNPFQRDSCTTGLDGRGYVKIADRITDYTFTDTGVSRGQKYCYRILAHFSQLGPSGQFEFNEVESVPSNEACAYLKIDVPLITHVTVDSTDASTGRLTVSWIPPLVDSGNLDTLQNPGLYRYELYSAPAFNNPSNLLTTFSSPTFSGLTDTTYQDINLDSRGTPHVYKLKFWAADTLEIGDSDPASSVFLSLNASDQQVQLSWQENVPWQNFAYVIQRRLGNSGPFTEIDTVAASPYLDDSLTNDSLYCYRVISIGAYAPVILTDTLINFSQIACAVPIDTVPPCPPILTVTNNCDDLSDQPWDPTDFVNQLSWLYEDSSCYSDVASYEVYYHTPDDTLWVLIATLTGGPFDTTFNHVLSNDDFGLAGCYEVIAVDARGNKSEPSNEFCVDNCPVYELPNVFTPNGDGQNDLYTPFLPYRFVNRIEMKIYNRWGNLVFETTDPMINWDGRDLSGNELNEGVYFYSGHYYEERVSGEVKKVLPPKEGGGFIHLYR
jgi:gliding motility-associated-like protein